MAASRSSAETGLSSFFSQTSLFKIQTVQIVQNCLQVKQPMGTMEELSSGCVWSGANGGLQRPWEYPLRAGTARDRVHQSPSCDLGMEVVLLTGCSCQGVCGRGSKAGLFLREAGLLRQQPRLPQSSAGLAFKLQSVTFPPNLLPSLPLSFS